MVIFFFLSLNKKDNRCKKNPLVLGAGDETSTLVIFRGNTGDRVDLVGTSILVRGLLPLLGHGRGLLAT